MTPQEQIKVLAELDGWSNIYVDTTPQDAVPFGVKNKITRYLPNYLSSYDAIIPLVHKKINRHTCHSFFDALGLLAIVDWQDVDGAPAYEGDGSYFELWVLFKATPSQLCEALLRATGKWKE